MQFTVYKSSAGSGKTFTLVKEYLKLALASDAPDSYRYILAITFTNKAANEMKERVLAALKSLASDATPTGTSFYLHAALEDEMQLPTEVLRQRAQQVLAHILHHYGDFSISTIDKFIHRVVRAFAFDLKIPLNFEVELDQEELLQQAVDLLIEQVGSNPELTRLLVDFTEAKTDQEQSWNIGYDLAGLGKNLFKEDSAPYLERLRALKLEDFERLRNQLCERVETFEQAARAIGQQAQETIRQGGLEASDFAGGKTQGIAKYFQYLAQFRADKLTPSDRLQKNLDDDKWYGSKANNATKEAIDQAKPVLQALYNKAQELTDQHFERYQLYQMLNQHIHGLAVLNEIEGLMERIKDEENLVHISEFNRRIADIVLHEPIPFIYERLGERYRHYLVDEFQDTSSMQWQNLLPLLDNALGHGHFNMVVGDGKQAIYRWRGGEVEQFSRLPEVVAQANNTLVQERAQALARNYQGAVLKRNFRSKAEIVEFNNALFTHLAEQLEGDLEGIYVDHSQEFDAANTGGLVQAEMFVDVRQQDDYDTWTANRTEALIREALEDGFQPKDIAVVCRNNGPASALAKHLIGQGIPVVSSESLLLRSSPEVRFLMACMLYLQNGQSKRAQMLMANYLLHSGRIGAHLQQVQAHIASREEPYFSMPEFLQQHGFDFKPGRLRQLPLYELAESLIVLFQLASGPDPFIAFLLEHIHEFGTRPQAGIDDLVKWWEEKQHSLSIQVAEGTNAVTVMTIHKSKGLEFPVVIVPFADWRVRPGHSHLWIDLDEPGLEGLDAALVPAAKQLEQTDYAHRYHEEAARSRLDNFNLLYVAFTRPQERLYVLYKDSKNTISEFYSNFLFNHPGWQPEESRLVTGPRLPASTHNSGPAYEVSELRNLVLADWRSRLAISMQNQKRWSDQEFTNPSLPPQLVRTALAELHDASEVQAVVDSLQIQGIVSGTEAGLLAEKLERLVAKPMLQPFFEQGNEIAIEREILLAKGQTLTPDRLVVRNNEATLIGFKTGKELAGQISQLQKQAAALQKMGYQAIRTFLLDVEEEKMMPI